jgi:hypothetical protein
MPAKRDAPEPGAAREETRGLHSCQFGWLRGIRNSVGRNSLWWQRPEPSELFSTAL